MPMAPITVPTDRIQPSWPTQSQRVSWARIQPDQTSMPSNSGTVARDSTR